MRDEGRGTRRGKTGREMGPGASRESAKSSIGSSTYCPAQTARARARAPNASAADVSSPSYPLQPCSAQAAGIGMQGATVASLADIDPDLDETNDQRGPGHLYNSDYKLQAAPRVAQFATEDMYSALMDSL